MFLDRHDNSVSIDYSYHLYKMNLIETIRKLHRPQSSDETYD